MKIVHTESSWGWGGQELRIIRESLSLRERGHEVYIVSDPRSLIYQHFKTEAFRVGCYFEKKRPRDLVKLRATLKSLAPDIVICHSSTDHWLTAISRLTLKRKFPIIRMRHISAKVRPNRSTRWLYNKGCDAITTTGECIREGLIAGKIASAAKITSIPTGIDVAEFMQERSDARRSLGILESGVLIGIIATLRSWKGHEYLIRSLLNLQGFDAKLLVVGDGPMRASLEGLTHSLGLQDRVIFAGQQEDVSIWFASLDLFVLPSYANEGVPQAILQAMATGLPIISCGVGGIPEATRAYKAIRMVPVKDAASLGLAVREMLENLKTLPSRDLLRHVPFSTESMVVACERVYKETLYDYQK